jgi:hypothetical protein
MWRQPGVAGMLLTVILAGRAGADTPVFLGPVDSRTRRAVASAVEGAVARLARPSCQDVFSDFTDETGRSLSAKLLASGRSPADAFRLLRFVDGHRAPQCGWGARLAFTQTGSQVIYICSLHFRDRHRTTAEIILIHELLHTLGLGENPPTSDEITERVAARCGGR